MIHRLKRFLDGPYVQLTIGIILLVTSLSEAWHAFIQDLRNLKLGVHHGSAILGLFYALRAIAEILERLTETSEVVEDLEEETDDVEAEDAEDQALV